MTSPDAAASTLIADGDLGKLNAPDVTEPPARATDEVGITDLIREFIVADRGLAEAEEAVKEFKRRKTALDAEIQDRMIEDGMDSPPGVDGMTVFLMPSYYVTPNLNPDTGEKYGTDDIKDALVDAGLGAMLTRSYNGNQLRSLLREYAETHQDIPESLAQVVSLQRKTELRLTPMGAAKRRAAPRNS